MKTDIQGGSQCAHGLTTKRAEREFLSGPSYLRGLSLQQYRLHITPTFISFNLIFYIILMHKADIPHNFACFLVISFYLFLIYKLNELNESTFIDMRHVSLLFVNS